MQGGQVELLADFVHFLADDGDDLVERPLPEKEIGINPGGQLADVAGADEKLVAGDLGVRRSLAQRRDKQFRPAMHSVESQLNG